MITTLLIIFIVIVAIASSVFTKKASPVRSVVQYHYRRKDFLMTKAENDFFNVLTQAVGSAYYVFPQVRLSSLLDHTVKGQNWDHALHFINQRSVDYVLCDKQFRRPLL